MQIDDVYLDQLVEYRFRHKSGEWRTLEATGTNLLDDPAVGGIVINSRDVTERKLAETPVNYCDGRANAWWNAPVETRHL